MTDPQKTPFAATDQLGPNFPADTSPGAAPLFGNDAASIRVFTVPLDNAREGEKINLGAGTFIWAISATSKTAELSIQFNDQQSALVPFKQGQALGGLEFTRSYITNTSQPGESITFFTIRETRRRIDTVNPSVDTAVVRLEQPTVLDTIADVSAAANSATQVLAANSTRTRAVIHNLSGATTLRVGDAGVLAGRGLPLPPNTSVEIFATEAISVFNNTGAAVDVAVMWEAA